MTCIGSIMYHIFFYYWLSSIKFSSISSSSSFHVTSCKNKAVTLTFLMSTRIKICNGVSLKFCHSQFFHKKCDPGIGQIQYAGWKSVQCSWIETSPEKKDTCPAKKVCQSSTKSIFHAFVCTRNKLSILYGCAYFTCNFLVIMYNTLPCE